MQNFLVIIYYLTFCSQHTVSCLSAACHGLIGSGFVFTRDPISGHWSLNQSYPSPAGTEGHFGYAVDIAKNYSVIGAYGFGELVIFFS